MRKAQAEGKPFDLLICDVNLAGFRTGIDLWSEYRTLVPVFLTSSLGRDEIHRLLKKRGLVAPAFLQKPLELKECTYAVDAVLNSFGTAE